MAGQWIFPFMEHWGLTRVTTGIAVLLQKQFQLALLFII